MTDKNETNDVKKEMDKMTEKYRERLHKIFSKDTFKLSFDEREKLISGEMKEETCDVLEKHIEEDPEGISKADSEPDDTCICVCGTESILRRDKDGHPRIYKRTIQTKSGPVEIKEHGYYCSKCRKVFFPSQKNP